MSHSKAVKRIFRYLRRKRLTVLVFKFELVGCHNPMWLFLDQDCDTNWGVDIDSQISTTKFLFLLANGAISWSSKRQPIIALSMIEAK